MKHDCTVKWISHDEFSQCEWNQSFLGKNIFNRPDGPDGSRVETAILYRTGALIINMRADDHRLNSEGYKEMAKTAAKLAGVAEIQLPDEKPAVHFKMDDRPISKERLFHIDSNLYFCRQSSSLDLIYMPDHELCIDLPINGVVPLPCFKSFDDLKGYFFSRFR